MRTRTTSAGALPAARARRHPAHRLKTDAGIAGSETAGAPDQALHPWKCARASTNRLVRSGWNSWLWNHSIPDALAVAITTEAGVVIHTGDFKMDQLPLDGRITDLNALARLGDAGSTC